MMKSNRLKLTMLALPLAMGGLAGCGTTAATSTSSVTSASAGLGAVQANLKKYTPATADSSPTAFNLIFDKLHHLAGSFLPSVMATSYTPFGAQWTAATDMPDLYCGGGSCTNESIKNYMGQMIDPNFINANGSTVGAAGRYSSALTQTCLMTAFFAKNCTIDTDGLPAVGTCTVNVDFTELPTAGGLFEGCVVPANFTAGGGPTSLSLGLTITAVAGNANYTKKIVMTGAPSGGGTGTNTIYAKIDSTNGIFNFENIAPGDNQTGSATCGGSRFILALNGNVTSFQYESITLGTDTTAGCSTQNSGASHEDFFRIHLDTGLDTSYILGLSENKGSANQSFGFILSGQPSKIAANTGTISASIWANTGTAIPTGASTFFAASADGCVSQTTGSITTDGTLTCDVTGLDVFSAKTMLNTKSTSDMSASTPDNSPNTPAAIAWTGASDFTVNP
jgi:hypothetical protein